MGRVQISRLVSASPAAVYDFLSRPENAGASLPSDVSLVFPAAPERVRAGMEIECAFARFGLTYRVAARVESAEPERKIAYRVLEGPLREWDHAQLIAAHGDRGARITDVVRYRLPFGIVGDLFDDLLVRRDVERILRARQSRLAAIFAGEARE